MSYHRDKSLDKNLIFSEYFNDEQSVRRHGGVPTDVTFDKGIAEFNGTTSIISYSDFSYGNNAYSISIRAKRDTITEAYATLFGSLSDYGGIIVYENGNITLTNPAGSNSGTVAGVWTDKTKYHDLVLTLSGIGAAQTLGFYFDGVLLSLAGGSTLYSIESIKLGDFLTGGVDREWIGSIELVEIYNKILTAEEVTNLYNDARYVEPQLEHGEQLGEELIGTLHNSATYHYDVFDFNGIDLHASDAGGAGFWAALTDGIDVVEGEKYILEADSFVLNSGTAPLLLFQNSSIGVGGSISNSWTAEVGTTRWEFIITSTTTAFFEIGDRNVATDFDFTNLRLKKVVVNPTSKILHVTAN